VLGPALLPLLLLAGVSGALPGLPLLQGRLVVLLQGSLPVLVLEVRAGRGRACSCSCNVVYMLVTGIIQAAQSLWAQRLPLSCCRPFWLFVALSMPAPYSVCTKDTVLGFAGLRMQGVMLPYAVPALEDSIERAVGGRAKYVAPPCVFNVG
jgi:hypothetical protein